MCGISGWFSVSGDAVEARRAVEAMVDRQRHRGPDDRGIEEISAEPLVVFGHDRLAIIDLSPDGHQPMRDPETGNVIVFNGEIYNFRPLRQELESLGQRFRTRSDTEVLLKAYAAWGRDCCERLRGIFAFALWDAAARELFVARDQLGVKPFYYALGLHAFVFASEVRALLASGQVPATLDRAGLASYLTYGSVQEPYTLIAGVRSLPPGSAGTVGRGGLVSWRYWNAVAHLPEVLSGVPRSPQDKDFLLARSDALLREAVSLQMVSDVTLGAFLSGGVDSSAIVSLMRQGTSGPIKTFSIVFDDPDYDERRYAALAARQNRTEHTELVLGGELVRSHLQQAVDAFDQPSSDGLNTWFVSKIVKEAGVTVALSGVGGDELFVGYGGFKKALLMGQAQRLLRSLPVKWGSRVEAAAKSEPVRKAAQMVGYPWPAYFLSRTFGSPRQIASWLAPTLSGKVDEEAWRDACFSQTILDAAHLDEVSRLSYYEMRTYMLSTLLRDTDQMSMAHSLEVRVPLIDHEVVAFMLGVPPAFKLSTRTPKPMLVHGAGEGLPAACVHRPKRGFTLPFHKWLRSSLLEEMRAMFVDGHGAHAAFSPRGMRVLWDEYVRGEVSWSRIWNLFVLNHWLIAHRVTSN